MSRLVIFIVFALSNFSLFAQEINVASFNIRLKTDSDVGNLWQDRKEAVCNLITYHEFDIFGIQEGFQDQVEDIQQLLPDFDYVGVGRDNGAEKGEHSAIFYNKNRFDVLKSGTFWLSATDTEKPNKGWDAALPRICTWGIFRDKKNNKSFILMNTHFDHVGVQARKESAKLILNKATEFATALPLILTGDFNVNETDEAYFTLANSGVVEDVFTKSKIVYTPNSTFNNWGKSIKPTGRIDHIFITPHFNVEKYGILTDTYMGKYPSDHFPVTTRLAWQ